MNQNNMDPLGSLSQTNKVEVPSKVLVGFLFSYSRKETGEFWPLYEGKNSVGSGDGCSIQLLERTISDLHANVFCIRDRNQNRLDFRIQDAGSETSTTVDGEQLMVGDVSGLKDRSVIEIGGYVLIAVTIDYVAQGFVPNPGFQAIAPPTKGKEVIPELDIFAGGQKPRKTDGTTD